MTLSLRTFLSAAVILSVTFIPFFAAHAERLTLSDGIRMVTEDNMLVKIRKQDELISESDTLIARSGLLPHVYGTYSQNYNEKQQGTQIQGQSAYTQQQDFYAFSLRAQQLLWDFKGVLSIYEASKKIQEARHLMWPCRLPLVILISLSQKK